MFVQFLSILYVKRQVYTLVCFHDCIFNDIHLQNKNYLHYNLLFYLFICKYKNKLSLITKYKMYWSCDYVPWTMINNKISILTTYKNLNILLLKKKSYGSNRHPPYQIENDFKRKLIFNYILWLFQILFLISIYFRNWLQDQGNITWNYMRLLL